MRLCLFSLLILTTLAGCQSGGFAQFRAREEANASWRQSEPLYTTVPNVGTFADGYKAGFRHVMTGGDPNRQPTPPGRLRNAEHRTETALLQAWHDGYAHGVLAAVGPESTQHETLDTTVIHEGMPKVSETVISSHPIESSVPFAVTPTDLPSDASAPTMPSSISMPSVPATPLQNADSAPKFVPPPPAPPTEDTPVQMMSGEQVTKTEAPRGITKPENKKLTTPPLGLTTAPAQPTTPLVKDAPQVPKPTRSEWEMPVFNSRAVFAR